MPKEGFGYRNKEMENVAGWAFENPKTMANVGMCFRAAVTLGVADFLAVIGDVRYSAQHSDTVRAPLSTPTYHYESFEKLSHYCPQNCIIVGVELCKRAVPLQEYKHFPRALYLFGSEAEGLSPQATKSCRHIIKLPSANGVSLNLATAASMVMWDRFTKINKERSQCSTQSSRSYFLPFNWLRQWQRPQLKLK